jgi:hypothetical protein
MPNQRITDLPNLVASQLDGDDLIYVVNVQSDTSHKITFSALAGDSLITLSAYDTQNTLNINYLSGNIDSNTTAISLLDQGEASLVQDINFLSASIDQNTSDILTVSAIAETAGGIGDLTTDVLELSGQVQELSANQDLSEIEITAVFDYLSGEIDLRYESGDSPTFTAINASTITTTGLAQVESLRIDQTATSTMTLTATHYVNVNISGTSYKMLLASN